MARVFLRVATHTALASLTARVRYKKRAKPSLIERTKNIERLMPNFRSFASTSIDPLQQNQAIPQHRSSFEPNIEKKNFKNHLMVFRSYREGP